MNSKEKLGLSYARRPKIFIASSSEALPIARAVKENLEDAADVDIWDERAFELNQSALDGLLNLSAFYDLAVALFTKDDQALIRDQVSHVTRGNVVFEYGLFLGRLGPRRAFFIAEDGVDIFSDWSGINTINFTRNESLAESVRSACDRLRVEMEKANKVTNFSLLPSTALAIGYYNNFLSRILESVQSIDNFRVVERDDRGNEIAGSVREISTRNRKFVINVTLPESLRDLEPAKLSERTRNYTQIVLSTKYRAYPFYVNSDKNIGDEGGALDLFDIPTTMLASKRAIDKIFGESFLAENGHRKTVESQEISNFEKTLRLLIDDKAEEHHFNFTVLPSLDLEG